MDELTAEEKAAYIQGLKDGIRAYAWWKDGTQYVGCGMRTLKQAIEEINNGTLPN